MKTLKKTLCLILAVVMVVGVLILPANADYTDADKISTKYETAVNVLTKLGVFTGKGNGSFDPAANLTRAEAATLVARIALGPTYANMLQPTTVYSDTSDPNFKFALGAIAYGTEQGIIGGIGGNMFAPGKNVTGFELAKMLLVTIGADWVRNPVGSYLGDYRDEDKYTGSTWWVNVLADYQEKGLDTGLEDIKDLNAALTREQAAQMILNAIKFQQVIGYSSVIGPDGKPYRQENWTRPLLETALKAVVNPYCHDSVTGEPFIGWYVNGELIYRDALSYELLGNYDDNLDVSVANLYGLDGITATTTANVTTYTGNTRIWYNGAEQDENAEYDDVYDYYVNHTIKDDRALNGLEVDLYYIDTHVGNWWNDNPTWHDHFDFGGDDFFDLVIMEANFAKVGDVTAAAKNVPAYVTITVFDDLNGDGNFGDKINVYDYGTGSVYDQITSNYKKDDYLAVYVKNKASIVKIAALEKVEDVVIQDTVFGHELNNGKLTNTIRSSLSTLKINGTDYKLNNKFSNTKTIDGAAVPQAKTLGTLYTLNGKGLGWIEKSIPNADRTILVTNIKLVTDGSLVRTAVDGYYSDGTAVNGLVVTEYTTKNGRVINDIDSHAYAEKQKYINQVYVYNTQSDGVGLVNVKFDETAMNGATVGYTAPKKSIETATTRPSTFTAKDSSSLPQWDAGLCGSGTTIASGALKMDYVFGQTAYFASDVKFVYTDGTVKTGVQAVSGKPITLVVWNGNSTADTNYYIKTVYVGAPYAEDNSGTFFIPAYGPNHVKTGSFMVNNVEVTTWDIEVYDVEGNVKTITVCGNDFAASGVRAGFHKLSVSYVYNGNNIYGYSVNTRLKSDASVTADTGSGTVTSKVFTEVTATVVPGSKIIKINGNDYTATDAKIINSQTRKTLSWDDLAKLGNSVQISVKVSEVGNGKKVASAIFVYTNATSLG